MDLKYRQRVTTSIDKNLYGALRELSEETKIPQSKLFDEAIEALLVNRKHPIPEKAAKP